MKKTIVTLFIVLTIQMASGQEQSKGFGLRVEGAAIHGREINVGTNFGYIMATNGGRDYIYGYYGPFVTLGYGKANDSPYYNTHIGFECYLFLVAVRAGLVFNSDFQKSTVGFLPEMGLTMMGGISFMYGYNAAISNNSEIGMRKHRLSLSFTFPVWIDNDWWPARGVANSY